MGALLTNILGGSLLGQVKGLIDEFHASPEVKAQLQAALDANAATVQAKQIELQEKLEDSYQTELNTASANIRAETLAGDKFTVRARPSYIYVCEVILFLNYGLLPLLNKTPVPFPDALFYLFGVCITGYIGARSWDKRTATNATKDN